ncbi:MAG: M23 family metallopeptidase [Candidatus Kapabacteria bacterium]|nr:M23 family metallopeptidase [Ignavibacteriota bacterium]MCW5885091.1 M23 family metallopeptidase [Candidatus Kapabacteria bacterium]
MYCFPLLNYHKLLPKTGSGSFGEFRNDRIHTGIDLYAEFGTEVRAVLNGEVVETGVFTSPDMVDYWNKTYFAAIQHNDGKIFKYCEMGEIFISKGELIKSGHIIGEVGKVINVQMVSQEAPDYIKSLVMTNCCSMLHFEMYSGLPYFPENYLGGNIFSKKIPDNLLNPYEFLISILFNKLK